ncbi:hypothetical protein NJ7G_2165 [Natrinema sp. J7-2]|nr:hypothetical protein NJ7G_2165 [Natrinema sp. J7-2]
MEPLLRFESLRVHRDTKRRPTTNAAFEPGLLEDETECGRVRNGWLGVRASVIGNRVVRRYSGDAAESRRSATVAPHGRGYLELPCRSKPPYLQDRAYYL